MAQLRCHWTENSFFVERRSKNRSAEKKMSEIAQECVRACALTGGRFFWPAGQMHFLVDSEAYKSLCWAAYN